MVEKYLKEREGNNRDGSARFVEKLNSAWLSEQSIDTLKFLLVSNKGEEYRKILTEYMRRRMAK